MQAASLLAMSSNSTAVIPKFSIQATDGQARAGVVHTRHGVMETPCVLQYTRRGNPLNLTPDVLSSMQPKPQGYQLDVLQFMSGPTPETLAKHGGRAHGYLALDPDMPVVATNRDPTIYEYGNKPSTDAAVYATIHSGGLLVSPAAYMAAVQALQPDLWVTLCDEVPGDSKPKRIKTSVDRSTKWLEACLAVTSGAAGDDQAAAAVHGSALAAIVGASSKEERVRSAKAAADKPVAGFALCGFGTGEDPTTRQGLIRTVLEQLPTDKLRFMSGMVGPADVLDAVQQGIDVLDDGYTTQVTAGGYALCFPLQPGHAPPAGQPNAEHGIDSTKMNLWSTVYRNDKGPIVKGCTCYTCKRHSRGYLHHLLQANEMLVDVLLDVHNTHHYQLFLSEVRKAIQEGRLEGYVSWFKGMALQHSIPTAGMDEDSNKAAAKRAWVALEGEGPEPQQKRLK